MVCQYSTRGLVSSGKGNKALNPGTAEGGGDASHITPGTIIVGRPVRCPHPPRSSPIVPTQQKYGDPGRPRNYIYMRLFSSGWRKTSSPWRRHFGSSSRQTTPWCASDTSPGIGTWPPPTSPTSEIV